MSKVSIIVPIYNVEPFIERCVLSVINQDFADIEIILVDDGSPDNSGKIIDLLSSRDNRVKVIHKNNGGVSSARNVGLKEATSEYIMFVDGDDFVEPNYVSSFLSIIDGKEINVGLSYNVINNNTLTDVIKTNCKIINSERACEQLYLNRTGVAVWNKIYRKDFLLKNNITFHEEYWFAEGMTFNIECFSKTDKVVVMNMPVYHQTPNAKSAVRKFNLDSWYCGRRAMEYQKTLIASMSQRVIDAWNYHYRLYNYSILCGIIKTNSLKSYSKEVKKCKAGLRKNIMYPLKVDIGIKAKLKSLVVAVFPIQVAKRDVKKEIAAENTTSENIVFKAS